MKATFSIINYLLVLITCLGLFAPDMVGHNYRDSLVVCSYHEGTETEDTDSKEFPKEEEEEEEDREQKNREKEERKKNANKYFLSPGLPCLFTFTTPQTTKKYLSAIIYQKSISYVDNIPFYILFSCLKINFQ